VAGNPIRVDKLELAGESVLYRAAHECGGVVDRFALTKAEVGVT
jgi:hypothetical protein